MWVLLVCVLLLTGMPGSYSPCLYFTIKFHLLSTQLW